MHLSGDGPKLTEFSLLHVKVGLSVSELTTQDIRVLLLLLLLLLLYLLQLLFHSVAVVVTVVTNKNKYI